MRKAGLLLPVFSLPGSYGIGDFGKDAYKFIDLLKQSNVRIWQILPLNPVGFGYSPYQPFSSFAGDEMYIDLESVEELVDVTLPSTFSSTNVDYVEVKKIKERYLRRGFLLFDPNNDDYQKFISETDWLEDYVKFKVLKMYNGYRTWTDWDSSVESYYFPKDIPIQEAAYEMNYEKYKQYLFHKQWTNLKEYAKRNNIEIMGDIPFYVGMDSSDVWANADQYLLKEKEPIFVAGVPPDYFAETGQRWGNPIYDWDKMAKDGYKFWIDRLSWNQSLFDIIRLDHFRAFDTYWQINAECETAIDGEWKLGPAYNILDTIYEELPDINLIAEDLGDLRPEVHELREHYNMYGMKITQFALDENEENNNFDDHKKLIVYTGTHDNQTIVDWYNTITVENRNYVDKVLKSKGLNLSTINENLIRYSMDSIADVTIVPAADILGLGKEGRINTPGSIGKPNWEWKMENFENIEKELVWFKKLIHDYNRF